MNKFPITAVTAGALSAAALTVSGPPPPPRPARPASTRR